MSHSNTGFSLIEIMVAVSIFSILLLVVLGITNNTLLVQRRDKGTQALQEELRFALEVFNREARTAYGTTYQGSDNGQYVLFRNQNLVCVEYVLKEKQLWRAEATNSPDITDCHDGNYSDGLQPLTSTQLAINPETSRFRVHPAQGANPLTEQGFITISLEAQAVGAKDATLTLESTVTSRQITPPVVP